MVIDKNCYVGDIRYNNNDGSLEVYTNNNEWINIGINKINVNKDDKIKNLENEVDRLNDIIFKLTNKTRFNENGEVIW